MWQTCQNHPLKFILGNLLTPSYTIAPLYSIRRGFGVKNITMPKFKLIKKSRPSDKYLHYYIEVDEITTITCCADSDEQATAWYNLYKANYKPSKKEVLLTKSINGTTVEITEHWKLDCNPDNLVMDEVWTAHLWVGNNIIKSIMTENVKYTQEQLDVLINAYWEQHGLQSINQTVLSED